MTARWLESLHHIFPYFLAKTAKMYVTIIDRILSFMEVKLVQAESGILNYGPFTSMQDDKCGLVWNIAHENFTAALLMFKLQHTIASLTFQFVDSRGKKHTFKMIALSEVHNFYVFVIHGRMLKLNGRVHVEDILPKYIQIWHPFLA